MSQRFLSAFLLLNPLTLEFFGMDTEEELREALEEQGCTMEKSMGNTPNGPQVMYYARATEMETLERLANMFDLEGNIVEVKSFWEARVEEYRVVRH